MLSAGAERFVRLKKSPLVGVNDAAWDTFAQAMAGRAIRGSSPAGGVGSWGLHPRRMGEIGVMTNVKKVPAPEGVNGKGCAGGRWVGDYVLPYSEEAIRADPDLQYRLFTLSIRGYDADLAHLVRPEGTSRSGCLAILHCGGEGALRSWPTGAFKTTKAIFQKANNLF